MKRGTFNKVENVYPVKQMQGHGDGVFHSSNITVLTRMFMNRNKVCVFYYNNADD